jgi:hypothetical protein
MHIYSLSMRLVWQEESAEVLSPLLLSNAPISREHSGALFGAMLQQQASLVCCDASLQYAKRWSEIEDAAWFHAPATSEGALQQLGRDPYRNAKVDEFRVLDLFVAGEAPLYALGYFSVGASKPHSRSKIALLFQELRPLLPRVFEWRMSPQKEQAPLSLAEVTSLGVSVVG